MTSYRDEAHLAHILKSIDLLPEHFKWLDGKQWFEHATVREAVLRTLQTMSESCGKLSEETKALAPEIDWKQIAGFRNVLAHDYLGGIDYEKVTQVIRNNIPELKNSVSRVFKELYDQ